MAKIWRPGKALAKEARLHQRRVSSQIQSARPPERGGRAGGTLANKVRARGLVRERKWGAVIAWHSLGDTLTYFRRGTRRGQPPRPLKLTPDVRRVRAIVQADAAKHFRQRARAGK